MIYYKQYEFRETVLSVWTELAVNQIVYEIIEVGEKKFINCSVFFDLVKAFNMVNSKNLVKVLKLECFSIIGSLKLLAYFKNIESNQQL